MRGRSDWLDKSGFTFELARVKGTLEWNDNDLSMLLGVHRFTLSKWRNDNSPSDFVASLVTALYGKHQFWDSRIIEKARKQMMFSGAGPALQILLSC